MENNEPLQHEYPLGVLVAFGPDAERATKYMATLIPSPDAAPTEVERWYIANGDIRDDAKIAEEVEEFFTAVKAAGRSVPEGIKGCPHDEGIDYPLGDFRRFARPENSAGTHLRTGHRCGAFGVPRLSA
jgi:hypothetical protein